MEGVGGGWKGSPSFGFIGMCGPKDYGFSVVLHGFLIVMVNRVWLLHTCLQLGVVFFFPNMLLFHQYL